MKQTIKRLLLGVLAVVLQLQLVSATAGASTAPVQFAVPDTTLQIQGFASSNAFVQIFDGDALVGTVIADANGVFNKNFPSMTSGLHNIRLQYQDASGLFSDQVSQTINVRSQSDTAVEYFLPPTVDISPSSVTEGDLVSFSGSSIPNATIEIILDGGALILRPQTDANGRYSISVDTGGYYFGKHSIRATTLQGGLKSFQSQKREFIVNPISADAQNPGTAPRTLEPPVITASPIIATDSETNLIRGTAPPYSQIIIYIDGEPVGSTFANSEGQWFFNVTILDSSSEIRVVACIENECSDLSNSVTIEFSGELGRCSTFRFWLAEYRYWGIETGNGIDVPVTGVSGIAPYEVLVDWGDQVTERFNRNDAASYKLHHVYDDTGQFNGSITMVDDSGCEYTRYFSVDVREGGWLELWMIAAASATLLISGYAIRKRFVRNQRRVKLAK